MYKRISLFIFTIFFWSVSLQAQSLWKEASISTFKRAQDEKRIVIPEKYKAYTLSIDAFKQELVGTPSEEAKKKGVSGKIVRLPMPDGKFERFEVYDSPIFAPKLAEKYPSIKSYKGKSLDTPGRNVRFDTGPYGLHAAIHDITDVYYIDPYTKERTDEYITYNVKDQISQVDIDIPLCGTHEKGGNLHGLPKRSKTRNAIPVPLSTYRLAVACTGEWGAQRGTVENALADINTSINRVNQIYENELAIRLVVIENNDLLLNFDADTDPYNITNDPPGDPNGTTDEGNAIGLNTTIVNLRVGQDSYDVGHLFHVSCDLGGIARLSSMCNPNSKAGGLTCFYTNLNFISASVLSHEMGHQMSAQHTFNRCRGENEQADNGFEPGSGSTIMAYGGLCGSNNVVNNFGNDDFYYHVASLSQIYNHTRGEGLAGDGCADIIETSNVQPEVTILHDDGFYIPENTHFFLEGTGSDENAEDVLTYCWEQMNLGPPSSLGSPEGNAPHFRSIRPSISGRRYFPSPDNILAGNFDPTEVPFTGNRTVNFSFTVRDNNDEAGTAVWDNLEFNIVETPVKFGVTSQESLNTHTIGDEIDVTWNVAATDLEPFNAKTVDILLFTGTINDFDLDNTMILAKDVFNNGQCKVIVPNIETSRARIIVRPSGRNFFSINRSNQRFEAATSPTLIVNSQPLAQFECIPAEEFTYQISSENHVDVEGNITYTVLDGLPAGATASFSPETVAVGETTELRINIDFDPVGSDNEIRIGAITEAMDTFIRTIYLRLESDDHSALTPLEPAANEASVGLNTNFSWSPSPNADFYTFELSTSPEFGDTNLATFEDLTVTSVEPNIFFEKNTLYYWRVTARNDCGIDPNVRTFAFGTESLSCTEIGAVEGSLPINITMSGRPTIQAPIEVNVSGSVADVNVKRFFGEHSSNKDMIVSLISPEGKKVILVDRICEQSNFNCGFDDASNVPVKCPLNNGSTYRPEESLSAFIGDDLEGTWNLEIEDTRPGNGGRLLDVQVEFCSNQALNNPFLVRNERVKLAYNVTETIGSDELLADDDNNTDDELIFTIVDLPDLGTLRFDGTPLSPGDQLSQQDINNGLLTYSTTDIDYVTFFSFTIIDGEGGFIGVTNFEIEVDRSVAVNDEDLNDEVFIYPNPAREYITIDLESANNNYSTFEIISIHGQMVAKNVLNSSDKTQVDLSQLNPGLYLINLRSDKGIVTKKVIVN